MYFKKKIMVVLLSLVSLGLAPSTRAQADADAAYQAKRQKAGNLFNEGQRLEALPLLEDLVQTNPKDDQMLVALAASLIEHAATLQNEEAAGKERLRARELLDRASDLGNTSTLAMNLSQLLKQLPENGAIKFSDNPEVEQAMRAGEAAFSRRDFDQALEDYSRALELEPKNYNAALFTANTYDRKNQFERGAEWYERAIKIDPNVETAYRYYADMLAKEGDMVKARAMLMEAAVAEPYNRMVWRELHAWATLNKTQLREVYIGVPPEPEKSPPPEQQSAGVFTVWQAYRTVRAKWQKGDEFKKRFAGEKEYRHSLPEESEALTGAAKVLESLESDKSGAEAVAANPSLGLLLELERAGLIEPYVLFSLGDAGIARDYAAYRAGNRSKLEEYMDKFVVPPVQ